jgi:S-adenosylmethionine:tRNA ribosyltransferase-isomerase
MTVNAMTFDLPEDLNASMPPERRGVRRDFVRMMVLDRFSGEVSHTHFHQINAYLKPGDVIVLNASRTIPAVLKAEWCLAETACTQVEVRLSHKKGPATWEALLVDADVSIGGILHFSPTLQATVTEKQTAPIYTLHFSACDSELYEQIYQLGEPVRYEYIGQPWSLDYYQTVYATMPGSVEMPSAGRAFSWELLLKLQNSGVQIVYVQLHTGLSYLLKNEWQQSPEQNFEEYIVPVDTVRTILDAKARGNKILAVGTTVVRALETSANEFGELRPGTGWTNLYIHADYPLRVVDALITGFHEPEASHLDLLSAFIDRHLLSNAYKQAVDHRYLWHEFGDMNLII